MARANWTNASVLALAPAGDPVAVITSKARELVAYGLDSGWTGPPFDPVSLAELLGIEVVASDAVRDARTLKVGDSKSARIEYNPNRPPARARFSIAHEIGHTIFPDYSSHVRNRSAYHELTEDSWQLEALCNIAAAEILMPAGSLPSIDMENVSAETILTWRNSFDVSVEAILIRLTHLATSPCAMFCASSKRDKAAEARYRIDYLIGSTSSKFGGLSGLPLPAVSLVRECATVGFTAHGHEVWGRLGKVHLECIAIPPYPGSVQPRVVGLVRPFDAVAATGRATYQIVRGDATRPRGSKMKIIAHVVNDTTPNWGAHGFAAALRRRFDASQSAYRTWAAEDNARLRLGNVHLVNVAEDTAVASLVAQKGYGPSSRPRIRYSALRLCLESLRDKALEMEASVHMPRIGAGQAGGQWFIVEGLIRECLAAHGVRVTVYDLPGAVAPPEPDQGALAL